MNKKLAQIYKCMKTRCTCKSYDKYKYYGGKGIKVLITKEQLGELWERDGADFMKRPSIDRLDENDHYSFYNCRFIELDQNRFKKGNPLTDKYKTKTTCPKGHLLEFLPNKKTRFCRVCKRACDRKRYHNRKEI